jgi:hypothetical protein
MEASQNKKKHELCSLILSENKIKPILNLWFCMICALRMEFVDSYYKEPEIASDHFFHKIPYYNSDSRICYAHSGLPENLQDSHKESKFPGALNHENTKTILEKGILLQKEINEHEGKSKRQNFFLPLLTINL